MIRFIITHSGRFHADDVCAAAVLSCIHRDATLIRTRDDGLMDRLQDEAIIFDVGRRYEPTRGRFDHHMRDAPEREDGTPYSSFGLVWKHLGQDYLRCLIADADQTVLRDIHERIDERMVRPIDMVDTGRLSPAQMGSVAGISLPELIDTMNPPFDPDVGEEQAERRARDAFSSAVSLVDAMLSARVVDLEAAIRSRAEIETEIRQNWGDPILVLKSPGDAQAVIDALEARHVLMIVQPSSSGGYGLTVGRRCAGSYDNLVDLPAAWGGLSGADLREATGVEGATFCHSALFFAAATTREAAHDLARLALGALEPAQDPSPNP
ncbi:MYG1 family protein [Paracoccus sp. ME4]|uniref:MYG1 family protein n=1 Tax=Paracoccus sp. ME4 TaxID=3138066 RepID=UPI00398AFA93